MYILTLELLILLGYMYLVSGNKHRHSREHSRHHNNITRQPSHEVRLVHDLMQRYDEMGKIARPTYNSSQKMDVRFGMRLIQMDIIEKEQVLKTSVWVRAMWRDEYLTWEPAEYGHISSLILPWDKVWTPDITLVNTGQVQTRDAEEVAGIMTSSSQQVQSADTAEAERPADVLVSPSGQVFWSPHRLYRSACLIDVSNFPYDVHRCHMWFQSMSRYGFQMDLNPYGNENTAAWDMATYLASFEKAQEWEILENSTQRYDRSVDIGVLLKFSRRVSLRFTLTVKRRPGYTTHLLMLPCVFLGSMTIIVFCLPPERPDRHTLAMSLFASFMVLLLILVEVAPPSAASIPMLGIYYACNMSLVMCSIFCSAFVIYIIRRGDRRAPVPLWMEKVFIDILSRPLMMHERVSRIFRWKRSSSPARPVPSPMITGPDDLNSYLNAESRIETDEVAKIKAELRQLREELHTKAEESENDQEISKYRTQWRNVGLVLDRMFLIIYFIAILTTSLMLFPRPTKM